MTTAQGPAVRAIAVGLLIGLLSLTLATSYVSVIFSGPLEPYRDIGLSMALLGGVVFALFGAQATSVPGMWWGNQSAPVVMVTIGVAAVVADLPADVSGETLLATAALFIMAATLLSGATLWLVGALRAGASTRFIPYPVIGGFLAATGVYLVVNGAVLAAPGAAGYGDLLQPGPLAHWLPCVLGAAAMFVLAQRSSPALALLAGVAAYLGWFYGRIALGEMTLGQAGAAGLLLGTGPLGLVELSLADLPRPGAADLGAISGHATTLIALVLLSLLALTLNISGLELQARSTFDLDREYRSAGLANLLGGAGGSFVGFHSVTMQEVARPLLPAPSRLMNYTGAAVLALGLFGALPMLEFLPLGVFALMLCFIGIQMIWRWLVQSRDEMPRGDYALLLSILAITLAFDFVTAVIVGIVVASLLFTVAYARIGVIRNKVTGRLRQSPTERPERDVATLLRHGDATVVFELQGYLFFGTSNPLYEAVAAEFPAEGGVVRHLIVDFRRVEGLDVSTAFVLARIVELATRCGADVAFCALPDNLVNRLTAARALVGVTRFPTLADALGQAEEQTLAQSGEPQATPPVTALGALLDEAESQGLSLVDERRILPAGDTLFHQAEPGDSLAYLEQGHLSAWVRRANGTSIRVASFLPGAIVGEIAFSNGALRTASVVADTPCRIVTVSRASLDRVQGTHPEMAARFHALLARLMADRLGRTTALLHVLDR